MVLSAFSKCGSRKTHNKRHHLTHAATLVLCMSLRAIIAQNALRSMVRCAGRYTKGVFTFKYLVGLNK